MTPVGSTFVLSCSVVFLSRSPTFNSLLVCLCVFPYMAVLLDSYGSRGCCTLVYEGARATRGDPHRSCSRSLLCQTQPPCFRASFCPCFIPFFVAACLCAPLYAISFIYLARRWPHSQSTLFLTTPLPLLASKPPSRPRPPVTGTAHVRYSVLRTWATFPVKFGLHCTARSVIDCTIPPSSLGVLYI